MHVDVFWISAALLLFPLIAHCGQQQELYVLMAPQILNVDTVANVFVEIQDYSGSDEIPVRIRVLNFPTKDTELSLTTVKLNPQNNYLSIAEAQIPYRENIFNADSDEKQYVYLEANFPTKTLAKIVLVNFQSGYLFVQTDKTIYTPDSIVKYRVFAMDTNLKPVDKTVIIETLTPEGIMVEQKPQSPTNGIKIGEYKLGSPISNGIWQISARFKNNPYKNYTAEFEVKEYVLPSFDVNLTPENPFFYVDDEKLSVEIEARYLFGKPVEGRAFAVFGVIVDNKKINLPSSFQTESVINGKGTVELKKEHIREKFNMKEIVLSTIYVSVSVLTAFGSEMVEAQRGSIYIVESPYAIHLTKTPKYFKPGMPFHFNVYVTNPDKTPAQKINLVVENQANMEGRTGSNGMAQFVVNTDKQDTILKISVKTQDPKIRSDRQAKMEMEAYPYITKGNSKNYLHIDVAAGEVEVGNQLQIKLNFGNSPGVGNQDFTYMILSKGQIVNAQRIKRSDYALIAQHIPVTKDMLPSFRIVAYYHVGSSEVVADSVWVDVKDTCMGKLEIQREQSSRSESSTKCTLFPITLKITGDPGSKVGLVAVDKGVYVLNNRSRLTQSKIWDYIENHDIACTAGSGKDSMGVFHDAGLQFQSDTVGGTADRREFSCPSAPKRRRRGVNILQFKKTLVEEYSGNLRQCCMDGMVKNLLDYSCERRLEYIDDGEECKKAFLRCCKETSKMEEEAVDTELILAKNSDEEITQLFNSITTRTSFLESWLWDTKTLPACGTKSCETTSFTKTTCLEDSITTWVFTAISLSADNSICVAEPLEIVAEKKFFIDLKLPYSAVVNEQIEIKAIIHNFLPPLFEKETTVYVELARTDFVCSQASNKKHRISFKMPFMSSRTVTFPIIPMDNGDHKIKVRAVTVEGEGDSVEKILKVVKYGVLATTGEVTLILDPVHHGGSQRSEIKRPVLTDQMPGTDAMTYISVRGKPLVELIDQALSGKGLGQFIQKPYGCAEQNMMAMVLPLITTQYLDKTNQWNDVGVDKRTEALDHISTGLRTELSFRQDDNSFGGFKGAPGSIWLTAYVVKMFSMVSQSNLVYIDRRVICDAIKFLILNAQMPNGAFQESNKSYLSSMSGKATEFSMTAFVLMALQEGTAVCSESVSSLENSKDKAIEYIERHISSERDPYAVTMASYTLANAGKLNKEILFKFASPDRSHWPVADVQDNLFTVEATGYALLTLLKINELPAAAPVMRWLRENQKYTGSYRSTQATVVAFQAIAKYFETVKPPQDTNLLVEVTSTARKTPFSKVFTKGTKSLQRSDKFKADGDLTITASGKGEGSISIKTLYYTKPTNDTMDCKNFELDIAFNRDKLGSYEGALETYKLIIEIKFLDTDREAGMTILDISMMTGFEADPKDLENLAKGKDRYIHLYEKDKQLSERGSLIIYLKKVSNKMKEKVVFRVHKMLEVGSPYPAGISVYEYYSNEERCVKFYDAEREGGKLQTICRDEVCLCAEENCAYQVKDLPLSDDRETAACSNKDYVYAATLNKIKRSGSTEIYTFTITTILKPGTDPVEEKQQREFSAHFRCSSKMDLKQGKSYLIMGPKPKKEKEGYWYTLGATVWIEYWPTLQESQGSDKTLRARYLDLSDLKNKLVNNGCTS